MWLFDTARYGRFLMGAAVLLSLLACERKQPRTRTIAEVVAAAKAARPAAAPPAQVVPVASAAAEPDAEPDETGPSVPEVTDRTGPVALAAWPWNAAQWDSLNAERDSEKDFCSTTRLGRFCVVEGIGKPRLFYQVAAHDSSRIEISLALPDEGISWSMKSGETKLDTANLDGRRAAELVLQFRPASYGSGGGTAWEHVSVIDVSATPMLLFRALVAAEDEAFGGYAALHGYKLASGDQFTGCKRSFKVRKRELVLGPVKTIGNTKRADCNLTQLTAGHYRYRGGKLFRVRK